VNNERQTVVAEVKVFKLPETAEGERVDAAQTSVTKIESTQ